MTALPPAQMRAMSESAARPSITERWEELHVEADRVAKLAGLVPEKAEKTKSQFVTQISTAGERQMVLASQAIDDIAAMLRSGLQALQIVEARGGIAHAPALALWREFHVSRGAVLALLKANALGETA